jgi:hypothetical protein
LVADIYKSDVDGLKKAAAQDDDYLMGSSSDSDSEVNVNGNAYLERFTKNRATLDQKGPRRARIYAATRSPIK